MESFGILSLVPVCVALILAFVTRDAILSLLAGIFLGVLISGQELISGFSGVLQTALGNADFIWVLAIEVFVGILVAFFQLSGAIQAFSDKVGEKNLTKRGAEFMAYALGMFIFFSDYFSPLYVGNVMRPITDKAKSSREFLAYVCDSTSGPICSLIPFTSWGIYVAGLLVGIGPIANASMGQSAVIKAAPYNFYAIFALLLCGLLAGGVFPHYGPMKEAERRAFEEGKPYRDGANLMLSKELDEIQPKEGIKPKLLINFFMPAIIIIAITVGTYIGLGSAKTLEAMIAAVVYQFITILLQRMASLQEMVDAAVKGIKSVMSAILILSLAYCINHVTQVLGTANYIISITKSWMTPLLLLPLIFLICGVISFLTGSSWGTYAIMTPIAIPLALSLSGNELGPIVYAAIAAILGGGCFGDHCSPISDTTILSSLAAGSDHMDHVKTQLPYALTSAGLACVAFIIVGAICL
jgi:Na+/H+ antiporter NhaC